MSGDCADVPSALSKVLAVLDTFLVYNCAEEVTTNCSPFSFQQALNGRVGI